MTMFICIKVCRKVKGRKIPNYHIKIGWILMNFNKSLRITKEIWSSTLKYNIVKYFFKSLRYNVQFLTNLYYFSKFHRIQKLLKIQPRGNRTRFQSIRIYFKTLFSNLHYSLKLNIKVQQGSNSNKYFSTKQCF